MGFMLTKDNISERLKTVGQVFNVIGLIMLVFAVLSFFYSLTEGADIIIPIVLFVSGLVTMFQSLIIYALGQLVENTGAAR